MPVCVRLVAPDALDKEMARENEALRRYLPGLRLHETAAVATDFEADETLSQLSGGVIHLRTIHIGVAA